LGKTYWKVDYKIAIVLGFRKRHLTDCASVHASLQHTLHCIRHVSTMSLPPWNETWSFKQKPSNALIKEDHTWCPRWYDRWCRPGVDNKRPTGHIWPATAFSVTHGSIQQKSEICWKCLRLHLSHQILSLIKFICNNCNCNKTFLCVPLLFLFYLFYDQIRRYDPLLNAAFPKWPLSQKNCPLLV